jgi:hypothetical protein
MVQLERGRAGTSSLKRAATLALPESLVCPSFDEPNVSDPAELSAALRDLATSAGLLQQKRWSVALPEATSRSLIVTLESQPASRAELEEVLTWKMERGFATALAELSISREKLPADAQGRDRYLVVATRAAILGEYEQALHSLGKQPLIVRSVTCDADECEDELYRLLLFYRDRRGGELDNPGQLARVLLVGESLRKDRACEIVSETLGANLRPLGAHDLGLQLMTRELSFDAIAAPAGLATLAWQ